MSQLISAAANTTYDVFDTKIPSLTQNGNIVEALRLYHYGKDNYTDNSAPAANSMYMHLKGFDDRLDSLESGGSGGSGINPILLMGA